jgi:hypothetical protein
MGLPSHGPKGLSPNDKRDLLTDGPSVLLLTSGHAPLF